MVLDYIREGIRARPITSVLGLLTLGFVCDIYREISREFPAVEMSSGDGTRDFFQPQRDDTIVLYRDFPDDGYVNPRDGERLDTDGYDKVLQGDKIRFDFPNVTLRRNLVPGRGSSSCLPMPGSSDVEVHRI